MRVTASTAFTASTRIVWVEHPGIHRYLRQSTIVHPRRAARPGKRWHPGRLVAYSALPDDAMRTEPGFRRLVWWLAERDLDPDGPFDPMRLAAATGR